MDPAGLDDRFGEYHRLVAGDVGERSRRRRNETPGGADGRRCVFGDATDLNRDSGALYLDAQNRITKLKNYSIEHMTSIR
jgi:hypothetical protein